MRRQKSRMSGRGGGGGGRRSAKSNRNVAVSLTETEETSRGEESPPQEILKGHGVKTMRKKTSTYWKRRSVADGRLLRDLETEVRQLVGKDFCIQMEVRGVGMSEWCWMIFIYLSTDKKIREKQWEFLETNRMLWGNCWVVAEDWNDISCNEEKRGGVKKKSS
ncbi:K-box region and MADS-box transcription factor family protein [Striga asiatica]|uniref:K-box region and MADS-box transcription factor family protein n=1 Tax=Striga asiatica TaxID=4170 RepID=A0A5A7PM22_STRAF|nr:K-box region and MADS-box transcription factor family protein [Striga asiatica]